MNKQISEIMDKYIHGELDAEAANDALRGAGAGYRIDPKRRLFSASELLEASADSPETASGVGILDDGIRPEKVEIRQGRLVNCDMGEALAYVYIAGKKFQVKGTRLTLPEE